jgi:hypothetical protein
MRGARDQRSQSALLQAGAPPPALDVAGRGGGGGMAAALARRARFVGSAMVL